MYKTMEGVFTESKSLYVGDLDVSVNESLLFGIFGNVATISSLRVCRDQVSNRSLGYAYVNFNNTHDAAKAKDALNFKPINGKPMRIMYVQRDPSTRKSGRANIFIKNLDRSIDNTALLDIFVQIGTVVSCKVAVDFAGRSKGYGFVQFLEESNADEAIKRLNGMSFNGKIVYVGLFVPRQLRLVVPKFTNVYVKNLPEGTEEEDLKKLFERFGVITSAVVARDDQGKCKGFGFVNFESPEEAEKAVLGMNGISVGDEALFVGRAQKKADREAELRAKFEKEKILRYEKLREANLYVKNFDLSFDDEKLKEIFSEFGTITSCTVVTHSNGTSRGFGFVAFSTPEEAKKAMIELNGKTISGKPLYVAVAQRKEERKAQIERDLLGFGMPGILPPPPPPVIPNDLYSGPQRPILFNQGGPSVVPPPLPRPPLNLGFQRQMPPSFKPYMMPPPNFMGPPYRQHLPMHNQAPRFFPLRGPPRPNASFRSQRFAPPPPMPPAISLASALASATPDTQREMLGERLFPLVEKVEETNASKVTGMLLELDHTEVLHLIESPEALKNKVSEAMDVLSQSTPKLLKSDNNSENGEVEPLDEQKK